MSAFSTLGSCSSAILLGSFVSSNDYCGGVVVDFGGRKGKRREEGWLTGETGLKK